MKGLLYSIVVTSLFILGCSQNIPKDETEVTEDSINSVIEFMCKEAEKDILTPEEAEEWDSMNANGGYMLVRGAERYCDTIVNHLHMIFITES